MVPLGVTVHSSAPLPSAVGRPIASNGAVSNSGARARMAKVLIVPARIGIAQQVEQALLGEGPVHDQAGIALGLDAVGAGRNGCGCGLKVMAE